MSLLIVEIPPRARGRRESSGGEPEGTPGQMPEWFYAYSTDGRTVAHSGQAASAVALPQAGTVIAALDAGDIAWHRVTLPRMPASKLRAALSGALEDALLGDADAVHLALGPASGAARWVAAVDRAWLGQTLATLEQAGRTVDRVVPLLAPLASESAAASAYFDLDPSGNDEQTPRLALATPEGVCCLHVAGTLARQVLPADAPMSLTAAPGAAAAAERWIGAAVPVVGRAERLIAAAGSDVNLCQFELASGRRGTRWLRDAVRALASREWRWVRWGVAALVIVQLAALNVAAFQLSRRVAERRDSLTQLLRSAHPQVRAVLDAPVQMQRETDALRAAAGRPSTGDLELLLAAASLAWPDGTGPAQMMRFEPGRLSLSAPGFPAGQLQPLRERLQASGFDAEFSGGRVTITKSGGGAR